MSLAFAIALFFPILTSLAIVRPSKKDKST
jgi:hypothetical protein